MLHCILTFAVCLFGLRRVEAVTCYQCNGVSDTASCSSSVLQCAEDEYCFAERKVDNALREYYIMGCQKQLTCQTLESSGIIVGRKRNERNQPTEERTTREATLCNRCCYTSYCNLGICGHVGVTPTNIPALSDIYVRLFAGNNPYEGTVSVYYNGVWGTVCEDNWSADDARVVCGMLGYRGNGATGTQGGWFLPGQAQIWLDDVTCSGTETSLSQCTHGAWGVSNCAHNEDAGVICSSVVPEDDVIFLVDTGSNGVIYRMNLRTQSFTPIPLLSIYSASTLDYDPSTGRIYFTDARHSQIVSMRFDGTDLTILTQLDINAQVENAVVDPINKILVYTDDGLNVIGSINLDGSDLRNVVSSNVESPRGLALDPRTRIIYWTDWGTHPKIEAVDYDGFNRKTLANTNLRWPNEVVIDYTTNMLYFVDGGLGTLETMDLNGANRRVILRDSSAHFFSLDVFGDYLYYTDWNRHTPMRVKKDGSGLTSVGPPSFKQLSEIKIHKYGTDLAGLATQSPLHFDQSRVFVRLAGYGDATTGRVEIYANGQWGTICDDTWDDNDAKVVCHMLGFDRTKAKATSNSVNGAGNGLISLDGVYCTGSENHIATCGIDPDNWAVHNCAHTEDAGVLCEPPVQTGVTDSPIDNFLIFAQVDTGLIVRMDLNTYSYTMIPVGYSPNPVAITFDPNDQLIYFSEVYTNGSEIRTTNHRGTSVHSLPNIPPGSVIDGLAIDKSRNVLFYTDAGNKRIVSVDPNGSGFKIVSANVDQPRGLALDRKTGVVFWTDWGASPKIEKANYDGSNRQTLVNTGLSQPNGIAVDPDAGLLYFCDSGRKTIEVVNIDGTHRKVLFRDYTAHFFGLTITSQYIYYSDWTKWNIYRLNRDGTNHVMAGPDTFQKINGVFAYQSSFS
ncbi:low-density lipoprotein receptor-related protein 4-like [Physella acuta]|uniref:low-density lipoprotein receptor-related protein 4-like n=1 Tax=Physella acuta TaxID=109671 RepID=UPI0027DBBD91|nr:low-density lipoprotein receptor-related protein 4-like [Physella acuta]